jgi:hypothetical protein
MTRNNARRAEVTEALGQTPTTVNDMIYHYSRDLGSGTRVYQV